MRARKDVSDWQFSSPRAGDILFEQPTRYYLVVNRKTANVLGSKANNELLARADKLVG